jgi:hypothetical protein
MRRPSLQNSIVIRFCNVLSRTYTGAVRNRVKFTVLLFILAAGCGQKQPPAETKTASAASPVKILHFGAGDESTPLGQPINICYGVENAEAVKIEPYIDRTWPSLSRCVQANPKRPTIYVLTATGKDGKSVTAELKVGVGPASEKPAGRELITSFAAMAVQAAPREPFTLCYSTRPEVTAVSIQPAVRKLAPGNKVCFPATIDKSTTFILSASTANGETDRMQVTVKSKAP